MKICLVTRYFDFRNAGIGRFSMEMKKGLEGRGHEVFALSTDKTSLLSYFNYTFFELQLRLPKGFDVYHALTPMEAMWMPKSKSVVTILDLIPITNPERAGAGIGYNILKRFVGSQYFQLACNVAMRCKKIICISKQTKDDVLRKFKVGEGKVEVIKLGISADLEATGKQDDVFRIGYLGQLDRRKRVNLLIKAVKESSVNCELVIGGTGVDEERLKKLAESDRRIKFLGLVSDDKLVDFYNSLSIFVIPTWVEGYGLPIVEAMACEKPVVVLKDAIIPEEVKSRCIRTNVLNTESLIYLSEHIDHSLLNSNSRWAKEHSWSRCMDEYIRVYEEVRG